MKKIFFYTVLISCIVTSCSDDERKPSCLTGYYGENCDTPVNTDFSGTWTVEDLCSTSGEDAYYLTLTPSTEEPREFSITGMWGESTETITVLIRENNRLKFSEGTQPLGNSGFTIEVLEGTMTKDGDYMTIEYIIYSGPVQVESCTASCTRE